MIKIPVYFLLSFAVFIMVLLLISMVFGGPRCDSLANTTSSYLRNSIDNVANYYPEWTSNEPPPDSGYRYYERVPIRLCQEAGTSLLESFFPQVPEYQIYHEVFPEGGGGTWTEAYPWSGGAASSLKFWGMLRIGTGVFKVGAKLTKYLGVNLAYNTMSSGMKKLFNKLGESESFDDILKYADTSIDEGVGVERSADVLLDLFKQGEEAATVEELQRIGFVVGVDDSGKYVIGDDFIDAILPITNIDGSGAAVIGEAQVYVLKQGDEITGMTTDLTKVFVDGDPAKGFLSGWEAGKFSPADIYKQYLGTLDGNERRLMEEMFVVAGENHGLNAIKDKIGQTAFYQKVYEPVKSKLQSWVNKIETLGYRVKQTVAVGESVVGMKSALASAVQENDEVAEMILKQDGIKDIIRRELGLSAEAGITKEHLIDFIENTKMNGVIFIPRGLDWEAQQLVITNAVSLAKSGGEYTSSNALWSTFSGTPTGQEIISDVSKELGISATEAENRLSSYITVDVWNAYVKNKGAGSAMETYMTHDAFKAYLNHLSRDWAGLGTPEAQQAALKQIGLLTGYMEQNTKALPMTKVAVLNKYFTTQAKKIIYLDGTAILNPGTTYQNMLFRMFIGVPECEGNSVCLVQKNTEIPFYMNETTDKYDVRLWRPVGSWMNWLGWQAALNQVPSNPRFYVVSPCFAVAKVWKTSYGNKPTIFIQIEKKSVGGEASNYCYADEDLIKEYTAIWALSDAATIAQTISGLSLAKSIKTATAGLKESVFRTAIIDSVKSGVRGTADKIFNIADPVTLSQGIAEGFVSWPEWPWKPLNYAIMQKYASNLGVKPEDLVNS